MDSIIVNVINDDEELKCILKNKIKKVIDSDEFQEALQHKIVGVVEDLELESVYEMLTEKVTDYVNDNMECILQKVPKKKKKQS